MKTFIATICIILISSFTAFADEGDILPEKQRACYETPPSITRMELINNSKDDPTINYESHYLNNDSGGKLSVTAYITPKTVIMKLFSGIYVADFVRMHDDFRKLMDYTDLRDITLVINSPGGSAFDGLSIASLIDKAKNEWGFTVRAEGSGVIASAAVPVLAVCEPRHVAPGTLIMVHEAALWKWPGRETASDINAQKEMMGLLADRYLGFLVDNTTTSKEDWAKMIEVTTWMNPEKAKELGLVDEIK